MGSYGRGGVWLIRGSDWKAVMVVISGSDWKEVLVVSYRVAVMEGSERWRGDEWVAVTEG
jgi:hypothetical protein